MEISCVVESVKWERVLLYFNVRIASLDESQVPMRYKDREEKCIYNDGSIISFCLCYEDQTIPIKEVTQIDGDVYQLKINVTSAMGRQEIPDGAWKLILLIDGVPSIPAMFDPGRLTELWESCRSFLFDKKSQAYVVNLDLTDNDDRPELVMYIFHFVRDKDGDRKTKTVHQDRNGKRQSAPRASKRISLKKALLQIWYKTLQILYNIWHVLASPPGNRVLLATQHRAVLEGNMLCLHRRLMERSFDPAIDVRVWTDIKGKGTWSQAKNRLKLVLAMASADVVVVDDHCELLQKLDPAKETVLIQLWHAGYGFKSVGYSRFGRYGSPRLKGSHRKYTYVICASELLRPVYAEVFGIEVEAVIPTGVPRIDDFLNENNIESVKTEFASSFPELIGKKIVLFAPTFRGNGHRTARYDYSHIDFQALYDWCGQDAVILFRMHPFVSQREVIPKEYRGRIIDFADHFNTNDLLHVADVLITDYSSVVYEFALLNKPMLFFAYDEKSYSASRGFQGDYRELAPGKVCSTFAELLQALTDEDYEFEKVAEYRDKYCGSIDTGATDRVIDMVIAPSLPVLKKMVDTTGSSSALSSSTPTVTR